ncbi:MAG: DUF3820 family protein [Sulfuricaulis sp.]|nr:DUF3820 family protein [Sulfuricaulis sp.]
MTDLHELLTLERPLFVFDTETTGVDTKTDRIVELGFQQWTADGMVKEYRTLVNPGVPIPTGATAIHHITDEMVRQCTICKQTHTMADTIETCNEPKFPPTFKQLAANLAKGFSNCDFAGANVRFDLRILTAEMKRAGVEWNYAGARIVDCGRLEQLAVPRNLGSLHEKYTGAKHDGAHGALSDVRASTTVIVKQLEAHGKLPRDLDQLHEVQWPGMLCDGGQFRMVNGIATCQFGKWRGRAMRDIPIDYFDWLMRSDFPADVKALATDAKLGKFPDA